MHRILRPKAVYAVLTRDLSERMWASYNYWCDVDTETYYYILLYILIHTITYYYILLHTITYIRIHTVTYILPPRCDVDTHECAHAGGRTTPGTYTHIYYTHIHMYTYCHTVILSYCHTVIISYYHTHTLPLSYYHTGMYRSAGMFDKMLRYHNYYYITLYTT
jgi:hypothetical protein